MINQEVSEIKNHGKKMIAPIIITVIIVSYYVGIAYWIYTENPPIIASILGIGIPLLLAVVMIAVLIERIKEIRSGEEDDISNY